MQQDLDAIFSALADPTRRAILWEISLGHGVPPVLVLGGVALTAVALGLLLKNEAEEN